MTMRATGLSRLVAAGTVVSAALLLAPSAGAEPIPDDSTPLSGPAYVGRPATPRPDWVPAAPAHPSMAPNQKSNIHSDAYQSDTNRWAGPLGRDPQTTSTFQVAECASLTFDRRGRVETVCVGAEAPRLVLMDPVTLEVLATHPLPPRTPAADTLSDFSGGGYFYLDDRDRAVIPTTERHVVVIAQTDGPGGPGFRQVRDHDVSALMADDDKIVSALPDWAGRIVFVTKAGVVGSIDPATGPGPPAGARRGDRQLLRRRRGRRRLRGHRPRPLPARPRPPRSAARDVAPGLRQQRACRSPGRSPPAPAPPRR